MSLPFLLAFSVFMAASFLFLLIRARYKIEQFKQQIAKQTNELKKFHATKEALSKETEQLKGKLSHLFEDPVTHLLGWELFEDRLNQNIKESTRYQLTLGVLFIDIDNFKMINDALSYAVGDALLQEIAKRLQSCIRQVDSASRFSKDTFVILLTQLGKPETAAIVAQRILQALAEPFQIKDHELYITACIGISIFPTDGKEVATLLRSADQALHLAKEKGQHLYQFYQEKTHLKSQRELTLYTELSRESVFREFILYYQPIVNIKTKGIIGMDVLLHWQHSQLGLISPDEIWMHAERQRKSNMLTEWLLRSACKQFLHWRALGFAPTFLGMPISLKQLENSHFVYRLSQILQELKFNPAWLLLEIKGGVAWVSNDLFEKSFNMLHYLGVKIAVDDFGSDLFVLSQLKNLPISYLKLGRSLLENIYSHSQTLALIKAIVFLANSLSMKVIAQGVESNEQAALLQELGCLFMQGKPLGMPLSDEEVSAKMATLSFE